VSRHVPRAIRVAGPPVGLAIAATVGLFGALATFHADAGLVLNGWLLILGGIALWSGWVALTSATPGAGRTAFDRVRERATPAPSRLVGVIAMEAAILDAEWNRTGFEHELRPILRRIAAARLAERYQIGLESEPAAARKLVGEELWRLIEPGQIGVAEPKEASGRRRNRATRNGIPRSDIQRAIELLEAL